MTSQEVDQKAIFIGTNKQNYVSDYNHEIPVVAFGASNTVALWNPLDKSQKGVYHTLKKHTGEVTGVKFLPNTPFLVSVAEDNQVNVWKQKSDKTFYEHFQTLEGHENSVTCIAEINEHVFVTGGADHNIIIWLFDGGEFRLGHKFQVKSNFYPLALAVQNLDDEGNYVLAVGGTTSSIYIFTFQIDKTSNWKFSTSEELMGHEDWIKCLQFVVQSENKDFILASGSQDRYVRLWRLKLNEFIDDSDEDPNKLILLSNKQYKFQYGDNKRAAFSFEALIMGHDDWISGIQWHPSYKYQKRSSASLSSGSTQAEQKLQLLTATADTALMIWEMDEESGIWVCVSRLGEMSIKGASTATGASGGFWSCLWFVDPSSQDEYVLASGKTGAIRAYKSTSAGGGGADSRYFEEVLGVTGAVGPITDVKWSLEGDYFMATSLDQTTRLYAPWKRTKDGESTTTWHEIARPQIHGYDMICLDNITSTKFVSGGDEKILRVFELTKSIDESLKELSNVNINTENSILPDFASLPVLGLSNKADAQIQEEEKNDDERDDDEKEGEQSDEDKFKEREEGPAGASPYSVPPLESFLQRNSLATETEKLYGHGYEISCCTTSPSGQLIATACRSNNAKHAVIRVFNVSKDYQQSSQVLAGHNLTISSLEFSLDGKFLLAVSRDRQFSLWRVVNEAHAEFELLELNAKAHSRIIWDCSWLTVQDYFVTVSRDKQLKLWKVDDANNKVELINSLKVDEPIISVSAYKGEWEQDKNVVAIGLESGSIKIISVSLQDEGKLEEVYSIGSDLTPSDRISKLSFSNKLIDGVFYLAVGSNDTSVRLYALLKTICQ